MRATREALLRVARETVAQRFEQDRNLVGAFLCGSLLGDDHLLGGTTDIDLMLIHATIREEKREIAPLSDEVHLDIAYYPQRHYRQPRRLRLNPWEGPTVNNCLSLHDPQHFIDFVQASVGGQFDRADHVYERARRQSRKARETWHNLQNAAPESGPTQALSYLSAVEQAANAVASLNGAPLTERRLLVKFPDRAAAVGRPGLYHGILGLLGAPKLSSGSPADWLPHWKDALQTLDPNQTPPRLHPLRFTYYSSAIAALLSGKKPEAALWPLLRTWSLAAQHLPPDSLQRRTWQEALTDLGLYGEGFPERLSALDAFLDQIDETLEDWADQNGAWAR